MLELAVQVMVAPLLVGAAWFAARRWGHGIGGVVGAFPAIVGPVLLIGADRHGAPFAAQEAAGILLGLAGLSAFALAYGRVAQRAAWPLSLAAGWSVAAVTAALAATFGADLLAALLVATASLALAHRGLPRTARQVHRSAPPRWDLGLRMSLTVVLVVSLAAAASRLGATAGGVLAALPVLACILAVFTHRHHGGAAASELLRGMLSGMAGFVVFCALVAALVEHAGVAATFTAATGAALLVQAAVAWAASRPARALPHHRPRRPATVPACE